MVVVNLTMQTQERIIIRFVSSIQHETVQQQYCYKATTQTDKQLAL